MIVVRMQASVVSDAYPLITVRYMLREDIPFPIPQKGLVITIFAVIPTNRGWLARTLHKVVRKVV